MPITLLKPQFKNKKFKTKAAYEKWLKENTHKKIRLKDYGQDLLEFWLHESGEVLDVALPGICQKIYNGKFVDMDSLRVGHCLQISDGGDAEYVPYNKLIVEKII